MREHLPYQADSLTRFYGFRHDEILPVDSGMLSLEFDAKLAWALAHRALFPVDLNRAPREMLLRVPGQGVKTVDKLLGARRLRRLRCRDLAQLRAGLKKVLPFVELADHRPRHEASTPAQAARWSTAPAAVRLPMLRCAWPRSPQASAAVTAWRC